MPVQKAQSSTTSHVPADYKPIQVAPGTQVNSVLARVLKNQSTVYNTAIDYLSNAFSTEFKTTDLYIKNKKPFTETVRHVSQIVKQNGNDVAVQKCIRPSHVLEKNVRKDLEESIGRTNVGPLDGIYDQLLDVTVKIMNELCPGLLGYVKVCEAKLPSDGKAINMELDFHKSKLLRAAVLEGLTNAY